jgi:hypothetical protein
MRQEGLPPDHITAWERAVCYYTLPRVITPVAYGLIVIYTILLFQGLAIMIAGVVIPDTAWVRFGSTAIIVLVMGGLAVFMARALVNDIRTRRALGAAAGVPDPGDSDSGEDLPDPFEGHILLKRPVRVPGTLYSCTTEDASIQYFIEHDARKRSLFPLARRDWWRIKTPQDEEVCTIEIERGGGSFLIGSLPGRLRVTRNGDGIAHIHTRFGVTVPGTQIHMENHETPGYLIRNRSIDHAGRLVGRIYRLRYSCYLDIEEKHFNEGILAWFIVES